MSDFILRGKLSRYGANIQKVSFERHENGSDVNIMSFYLPKPIPSIYLLHILLGLTVYNIGLTY